MIALFYDMTTVLLRSVCRNVGCHVLLPKEDAAQRPYNWHEGLRLLACASNEETIYASVRYNVFNII